MRRVSRNDTRRRPLTAVETTLRKKSPLTSKVVRVTADYRRNGRDADRVNKRVDDFGTAFAISRIASGRP